MTNVPPTKALGQEVSTRFEEARVPSPHKDTAFAASFAKLLCGSQILLATSPARASSTGSVTQERPVVWDPTEEATGVGNLPGRLPVPEREEQKP